MSNMDPATLNSRRIIANLIIRLANLLDR